MHHRFSSTRGKMILELVLVALLILGILLIAYKRVVNEFQILQKDWTPNIEWSPLLHEALPLVIRNVDEGWRGAGWTRKATAHKTWPIRVAYQGQPMQSTWNKWISAPPGQPAITNMSEIAAVQDLPIHTWMDGGFRRWSWLPAVAHQTQVGVLGPSVGALPATKATAAATVLIPTDGAPLEVWLAHEGAVPASVALEGRDPWSITAEEAPWISEVKYVELRLRPGNALVIPTHWWWSARPQLPVVTDTPSMGDGSWYWLGAFHTPISRLVTTVRGIGSLKR